METIYSSFQKIQILTHANLTIADKADVSHS